MERIKLARVAWPAEAASYSCAATASRTAPTTNAQEALPKTRCNMLSTVVGHHCMPLWTAAIY